MFVVALSAIVLVLPSVVLAEDEASAPTADKPCSTPDFSQFDFWIGEWDLTWGDSAQGTNVITKDYDGCVIIEKFDGNPGMPFRGMSVSTFNARTGKWHQTWVDNAGGYLDFVGEFVEGKMILSREAEIDGKPEMQRMVWHNINEDELDWNWEKSSDGGQTWDIAWKIHYRRAN
jgi:hypothetical protein